MSNLIQQPFERFHISEEDLLQEEVESEKNTIPILKRSKQAKSKSLKLQQVSPTCVIVVGMAGSGKTTLMAALQRSLNIGGVHNSEDTAKTYLDDEEEEENKVENTEKVNKEGVVPTISSEDTEEDDNSEKDPIGYCLNLDPATKLVPFGASIDIRDTVDYKEVMKQYRLGPNGAIMTSLNLFSTKFDQVMTILENRAFPPKQNNEESQKSDSLTKALDYILVDTPGQIEAFTWSASGTIITSALSSAFPTVLAFVVDTPRCVASLNTFMSNMLYACSMFYRTRLPLVVVFNKCDVVSSEVCMEWMDSYEKFQDAMDEFMSSEGGQGFYTSLTRSLSMVLDEFYTTLHKVGVSAATGDGVTEFWDVVKKAADDFDEDYVSDLQCKVDEQDAKKKALAKDSLRRMQRDIAEQQSGV